jgi:hypothetical protein
MESSLENFLTEDDIIEVINEQLEFEMLDDGIGSYEFWGSKEIDKNLNPYLITSEVMVKYYVDLEQGIYTMLKGYCWYEEVDIYWCAELESVEWDNVGRCFYAEYTVNQE